MKTLIHLSDLHFGRTDPGVIEALSAACGALRPDLVVITGDFTQRARVPEFKEAAQFMETLEAAGARVLLTPGNHDIRPFFEPLARAVRPFGRFEEYIGPANNVHWSDREAAIWCLNTSRAWRIKGGSVARADVERAAAWFTTQEPECVRILATHHPLDLPQPLEHRSLAHHAKRGIYKLGRARVDIYLSGHYHQSSAITTGKRYGASQRAALALQAGTVSLRGRGEAPSFNVIAIEPGQVSVTPMRWDESSRLFKAADPLTFALVGDGWVSA